MHPSSALHSGHSTLSILGGDAPTEQEKNLRKAAEQFEAVFTKMMLKSMRNASFGDPLLDSGKDDVYRDMMDQELSTKLASGGGLGIADMLVRQLGGGRDAAPVLSSAQQSMPVAAPQSATRSAKRESWLPASPAEFVRDLLPHARAAAQRLGVSARALLAQAALETGWGKRTMPASDGGSSFNLFGIKAGRSWTGDTVHQPTVEFRDGLARREVAQFRAYDSAGASFQDYANLIEGSERYKDALAQGNDPAAFGAALQRAGYATDPEYGSKIAAIAAGETLRSALDGAQVFP